jgi:hypothetical protein
MSPQQATAPTSCVARCGPADRRLIESAARLRARARPSRGRHGIRGGEKRRPMSSRLLFRSLLMPVLRLAGRLSLVIAHARRAQARLAWLAFSSSPKGFNLPAVQPLNDRWFSCSTIECDKFSKKRLTARFEFPIPPRLTARPRKNGALSDDQATAIEPPTCLRGGCGRVWSFFWPASSGRSRGRSN